MGVGLRLINVEMYHIMKLILIPLEPFVTYMGTYTYHAFGIIIPN